MLKKCINLFRNIYVEGDIENNIDSSYTIDIDKYNELNESCQNIPNLYRLYKDTYFNKEHHYTLILYRTAWSILRSDAKSSKDFQKLDEIIKIYLQNEDLITPMENCEAVNKYLQAQYGQTFESIVTPIENKYGFDFGEYISYRNNLGYDILNIKKQSIQEYLTQVLIKHKKEFLDDKYNDKIIEILSNDILKEKIDISYKLVTNYPILSTLEQYINKVHITINLWEDKQDIYEMIDYVYENEQTNKTQKTSRNINSTDKFELLSIIGNEQENKVLQKIKKDKAPSKSKLMRMALLHKYRHLDEITSYEQAMFIYNFHIFMTHFDEATLYEQGNAYILRHSNFITYNALKDIQEGINSLKNLLKLI